MKHVHLTDEQRFPQMSERGWSTLRWMREHPNAPRWNHHCGDRLDAAAKERVHVFESTLLAPRERFSQTPQWVEEYARFCLSQVPIYRRVSTRFTKFSNLPTMTRAELGHEPWSFVPDNTPLDDLILYDTGGTTGQPIEILAHPEFSAKYLPLLRLALVKRGVKISDEELASQRISQVLVCHQQSTFTFATIATYWGESGFIKLNLKAEEWRDAADRARFLEECAPLLIGGDPLSFAELLRVQPNVRPRALVSTAMTLLPGLQKQLEAYFRCPVVDLYSLNECGPLAVKISDSEWEVLPHDVFIEVLDENDGACARGEIVLTGGRNPFLPLLRYRTGDFASLENRETARGTIQILKHLEGRAPVVFRGANGEIVNNIDVTKAFEPFALSQFALHQNADSSLVLRLHEESTPLQNELRRALENLFGAAQKIEIEELKPQNAGGKVLCYTSDLA
jgi:phenylacetate-CoA ligase